MFFCQKLALQDRDCDEGLELLEPLAMKTWSNCTGQGQGESKSLDPLEVPRDCGSPVLQRDVGTTPVVGIGSAKEPLR